MQAIKAEAGLPSRQRQAKSEDKETSEESSSVAIRCIKRDVCSPYSPLPNHLSNMTIKSFASILMALVLIVSVTDLVKSATIVVSSGGPVVVSPIGVIAFSGSTSGSSAMRSSTDQIPSRPQASIFMGQEAA